MSDLNLIRYKRANALFKRALLSAKRNCLEKCTSRISPLSTSKKVWSDIKRLAGVPPTPFKYIKSDSGTQSGSFNIAEVFAHSWSKYSSDTNFLAEYLLEKNRYLSESYLPDSLSPSATCVDTNFTLLEVESSIASAKWKSPGADIIPYAQNFTIPPENQTFGNL